MKRLYTEQQLNIYSYWKLLDQFYTFAEFVTCNFHLVSLKKVNVYRSAEDIAAGPCLNTSSIGVQKWFCVYIILELNIPYSHSPHTYLFIVYCKMARNLMEKNEKIRLTVRPDKENYLRWSGLAAEAQLKFNYRLKIVV